MFKKILANLPFNPSLVEQINFYSHRLRGEAALRRLGFIMVILSLLVQIVAAQYPAQNSLAASPNDIINGITTKSSLLQAWDNNTGNIRAIYEKFGIKRANIAAIPGEKPNATIKSTSRNWWSTGRLPLTSFGISSTKWGERTVNASGNIVYQRPLRAWDTGPSSSYAAFQGKNQFGVSFWILQTCGNPTFDRPYLPTPPKPKLTVNKTLLTASRVKPGEVVRFRIEYQNEREDSLATGFKLTDNLNPNFEFVSLDDLSSRSGNTLTIKRSGELGYRSSPYVSNLSVKVRANTRNNTIICNSAVISSTQTGNKSSAAPCITVIREPLPKTSPKPTPAPAPVPTPTPSPNPTVAPNPPPPTTATPSGYCVASTSLASGSNREVIIRTEAYVQNGARVVGYLYDIDGNGTFDYRDNTSATPYDKQISNLTAGNHKILVYAEITSDGGPTQQTGPCPTQVIIAEEPRVNLSKAVTNVTQKVSNADGTSVKSGDIIEFKLTTKNVTSSDYRNYQGDDYFGDVLQYAELIDHSELSNQGLVLDSQNHLKWTTLNLKANSSEVKTIRVKIKEIIPSTNSPSSLSPDYNCAISNDYGNEVTMSVDCPIVKTVAQSASTSLPNTGPGTTLAIAGSVAVVAGYLFARSRIMIRELEVIKAEYTLGGGM
ncbi:hypothetical protein H0X09_03535 [Candidatus Saccharibacteria bacterium]|nr:hypothetical protein [Candidatus Saccharibacteria bacterium]